MRPPSLNLEPLAADERFLRDRDSGLVWHRTMARVLYADTDRSGAVYHSNYLRYFEQGRATLMRDSRRPYADVERAGFVYPVITTGLNYYQSLEYDDAFWILTRPASLERVRVRFDYIILRENETRPATDGFTLHCALNGKRVPVSVDPATRELCLNFPV